MHIVMHRYDENKGHRVIKVINHKCSIITICRSLIFVPTQLCRMMSMNCIKTNLPIPH